MSQLRFFVNVCKLSQVQIYFLFIDEDVISLVLLSVSSFPWYEMFYFGRELLLFLFSDWFNYFLNIIQIDCNYLSKYTLTCYFRNLYIRNDVSIFETQLFSISYNNALFFLLFILCRHFTIYWSEFMYLCCQ